MILLAWYVGLMLFALLGLQWVAMRQQKVVLRAEQDRIRRMLMRVKLRKGRL